VRVSIGVLDRLMGIVSELVLTRNQLLELSADGGDERVKGSVQNLSSATSDLQDAVMRVRLQPLDKLFSTLPRLVRDLSLELRKKIRIETFGAETELDRQVIELMRAPLTHIIRNAADHGIESVAERVAAGKPDTGLIRVTAAYDAGQITLEIEDDGRGFDVARIKKKARERGLASARALEKMTDAELYPLVLLPGFSTAEQVSKVSGRGVGMDVVRDNIHSIGGTVSLASRAGFGTTVLLRIPLTLAIAPALILSCGGSRFAIPQMAVVEVVGVGEGFESFVNLVYGAPMLRLRGEALPLACLAQTLGLAPGAEEIGKCGYVVILRVAGVRCGLLVEAIADVQEVVIEPLVGALARLGVFSGQTILGDGSAVLILDPAAIVDRAGIKNKTEERERRPLEAFQPEKAKTCVVLLRAGAGPLKALPLSLIMRIEEVDGARLARSGDVHVLPYEGRLLPIFRAANDMTIEARAYPILVLAGAGQAVGVLVDEIIDVIEQDRGPRQSSRPNSRTARHDLFHQPRRSWRAGARRQPAPENSPCRRQAVLPRHAESRALRGGVRGDGLRLGRGSAGADREGHEDRHIGHRHRHARYGRLFADPPTAGSGRLREYSRRRPGLAGDRLDSRSGQGLRRARGGRKIRQTGARRRCR
jgi:two-component system chemotaxis sensor kinase CheA